jgi:hypothetical protein
MRKTTNNTLTKEDAVEYLINSGYDNISIERAIQATSSTDIDVLVDFMSRADDHMAQVKIKKVDKQTSQIDSDEARQATMKLIEENKKKMEIERKYKEELIRRTIEDRKNKEKEEREKEELERASHPVALETKMDCVINVRFPDSKSIVLYFNKEDTVSKVFEKIEENYGSSTFKVFKSRNPVPIEKSDEKLESNKLLYPKSVLFVED